MKKRTKFYLAIISASVIGFTFGCAAMHKPIQQCIMDKTFNRVECCVNITANGNCAAGQSVTVYNI